MTLSKKDIGKVIFFPNFHYESNQWSGEIYSLEKLLYVMKVQISKGGMISPEQFLVKSQGVRSDFAGVKPNFGTRREHRGLSNLKLYLAENGLLEEFRQLVEEDKMPFTKKNRAVVSNGLFVASLVMAIVFGMWKEYIMIFILIGANNLRNGTIKK